MTTHTHDDGVMHDHDHGNNGKVMTEPIPVTVDFNAVLRRVAVKAAQDKGAVDAEVAMKAEECDVLRGMVVDERAKVAALTAENEALRAELNRGK